MIRRLLFISLVFMGNIHLHGQNEMQLSIACREGVGASFVSKALIKLPNGGVKRVYKEKASDCMILDKENFNTKGNYTLSIYWQAENGGEDSIDYNFELQGDEWRTSISVEFDQKKESYRKGKRNKRGEKMLNGYIRVNKYYHAPKTIEISLDKEDRGSIDYKGPLFEIKNNSTETLYGEYLPGYLWGSLCYVKNDSTYQTRKGILDYEFVDLPPLYPGSVKLATVGSFGLTEKLPPFDYRFEVMLAKNRQSTRVEIYKKQKKSIWWAKTNEYYQLEYNFKIE